MVLSSTGLLGQWLKGLDQYVSCLIAFPLDDNILNYPCITNDNSPFQVTEKKLNRKNFRNASVTHIHEQWPRMLYFTFIGRRSTKQSWWTRKCFFRRSWWSEKASKRIKLDQYAFELRLMDSLGTGIIPQEEWWVDELWTEKTPVCQWRQKTFASRKWSLIFFLLFSFLNLYCV